MYLKCGLKRSLRFVILAANATSVLKRGKPGNQKTKTNKPTNNLIIWKPTAIVPSNLFLPRKFSLYSIKKQYKTKHEIKKK